MLDDKVDKGLDHVRVKRVLNDCIQYNIKIYFTSCCRFFYGRVKV